MFSPKRLGAPDSQQNRPDRLRPGTTPPSPPSPRPPRRGGLHAADGGRAAPLARALPEPAPPQRLLLPQGEVSIRYNFRRKLGAKFNPMTRDRCYDQKFLRFPPIFGEKMAFFSKTKCYG
jgi:hypothetical protein